MAVADALGTRIKLQYEMRTRYFLPRRTYTIIRCDGRAFHSFTSHCERPFDSLLAAAMDSVAEHLCLEIQGADLAYVQSDEISILLTDFARPNTDAWFDGNIQKMASVAASAATALFNQVYQHPCHRAAQFDARVFTIPDPVEVENYFIWRQQDATRNSIQMAAQTLFPQKELHGKNTSEQQEMLFQEGVNWNDYPPRFKRGAVVRYDGTEWLIDREPPVFTQERTYLRQLIPQHSKEAS